MDLVLSRKCAEQRLWPAINITQSGTRKEHLLLDTQEMQEMVKLRRVLSNQDEIAALAAFIEHLSK
jgi:transcription termination factor Rho